VTGWPSNISKFGEKHLEQELPFNRSRAPAKRTQSRFFATQIFGHWVVDLDPMTLIYGW